MNSPIGQHHANSCLISLFGKWQQHEIFPFHHVAPCDTVSHAVVTVSETYMGSGGDCTFLAEGTQKDRLTGDYNDLII